MKISLATVCLLIVSVVNCLTLGGNCAPSQQSIEPQTSLSQDSYVSSGAGEGGRLLINLTPTGGINGFVGPTNNKRARKMSAFIPMRGRKDGRDISGGDGFAPREQLDGVSLNQPSSGTRVQLHDSDDSIWRLITGSGAISGSLLPSTSSLWLTSPAGGSAFSVPQQFANQFAAQHARQQQQQKRQSTTGVVADNLEQLVSPALFNEEDGGGGELMKAKPRRAFHPMRGKKSAAQNRRSAIPSIEDYIDEESSSSILNLVGLQGGNNDQTSESDAKFVSFFD